MRAKHFLVSALAVLSVTTCASALVLNAPQQCQPHLATILPHNSADDGFAHAAYLDVNSTVLLKWRVKSIMASHTNDDKPDVLVAELTAPTRGWMSFGVSPNGGMIGANMLVMWLDSDTGRAHVQDRYATEFAEPLVNDDQTAAVVSYEGYENATHTVMKFTRWLNAGCKSKDDTTIGDSAIRVIFAYGLEDPDSNGHIKYHGTDNRGSQALYLVDDVNGEFEHDRAAALAETTQTITFTSTNFSVPAIDTFYHCEVFELPENEQDLHIVGFEPVLQRSNLDIIHHYLVHNCAALQTPPKLRSFDCYNTPPAEFGQELTDCFSSIIWVWAVGGTATYMPQQVGLPLKAVAKGTKRYVMIETHYNNPALAAGRQDSSGFRMLLTNKLRSTIASTLSIGAPVDETVTIPGNTTSFTVPVLCSEKCTQKYLPTQGTTVFAVLLHSHLIGRSLALRHFRNGVELPAIASDPTYDFNYQQWRPVNVTIMPGDRFIVECNYSSTTPELRKNSTVGGFSTHDEMCYAFMFVTPDVPMVSCSSAVDYDKLKKVLKFDDLSPPSNATFEEYAKYKQAVTSRIKAIDWPSNAPMQSQLVDLYLHNPHTWFCARNLQDYLLGKDELMPNWEPYSPPDECAKDN